MEIRKFIPTRQRGINFSAIRQGIFLATKEGFEKIVMESSSLEELMNRVDKESLGKVICETSDVSFSLNGYICCFYLLSKSDVEFNRTTLSITNETARKDIAFFLERYLNESETKDFHVSIYDAVTFCNIFKEVKKRGYALTAGVVEYKDINEIQKIKLFQDQNYKSIVFTKSTRFSYQKEFRIFINVPNEQVKDHISVNRVEVYKSLLGSFSYDNIRKKD